MAVRTSGVGTERKLEFWDQYGVERYRFLPNEMLTPGPEYKVPAEAVTEPITFEFEKLLLTDSDATPEGAVLLKVLDEKLKLRNADDDADVILDEVFIPHTFVDLVKFARPANEPSVRIGDAGQSYQILEFSKRTGGGGIANLGVEDEASLLLLSAGLVTAAWSPTIGLFGIDEGSGDAGCIYLRSAKSIAGGTDYNIERLKLGVGAIADATWSAVLQSGLKLKDALDANSQKITNLAAGAVAGDSARYDELNALDGLVIKKDGSVAFTGNLDMGEKDIINFHYITAITTGTSRIECSFDQIMWIQGASTVRLEIRGGGASDPAGCFIFHTPNLGGTKTERFAIKGNEDVVDAAWAAVLHKGFRSDPMVLNPSAEPGSPVEGQFYYDSTAKKLKIYNGTAWETVTSA